MRIIHAIRSTNLAFGGPPRSTMDMLGALHRRGHRVGIVTLDAVGVPESWGTAGQPDVYQTEIWPGPHGLLTKQGRKVAQQALDGADFLHMHEVWESLHVQLAAIARRSGVPYCLSPRGSLDDWGFGRKRRRKLIFHKLFGKRMMERARFIHCTAVGERDQSQVWYPQGRTAIIPNLLDMAPYRELPGPGLAIEKFGLSLDRPILLYLGRTCEGKGLDFIIEALPKILHERPDAMLVVAGTPSGPNDPPWEAALRRRARQLGVDRQARFLGFVGGDAKVSLMQAASLFMLPSSHENFGNVLFEAAACGCPLLITRHVATWRELNAAGVARVVAQIPDEIAEAALSELAADQSAQPGRRAAIRDWTLDYFGGDRIIRLYERHYSGELPHPNDFGATP